MIATASNSANLMKPPPIGFLSDPTCPGGNLGATLALGIVHGKINQSPAAS